MRTEKECLKLVFAVLWRASERWRRIRFSEVEQKQLARYIEARERQRQAERRLAESTAKEAATA